jgi:ADP-ribosylglycohydrolase
LGLAISDTLGTPAEFLSLEEIKKQYGMDNYSIRKRKFELDRYIVEII